MIILTKTKYSGHIENEVYADIEDFIKVMERMDDGSFSDWLSDEYPEMTEEQFYNLKQQERYDIYLEWNLHDKESSLVIDDDFIELFIKNPTEQVKHGDFSEKRILKAISEHGDYDAGKLADEMLESE